MYDQHPNVSESNKFNSSSHALLDTVFVAVIFFYFYFSLNANYITMRLCVHKCKLHMFWIECGLLS